VIVVLGDIMPKLAAIRNPLGWALRVSRILTVVNWLLTPVVRVLLPFTDFVARTLGVERRRLWISEEEIKTLVEVGEEHGALQKDEKELIHSIFEFGDTTVGEIMVPRMDMVCLSVNTPAGKLLQTIQDCQHTRIPIFDGTIDNIVGILHTKDLLLHYPLDEGFSLRSVLRKPSFVPESKLISELLKQFQDERLHMTITVDEYGGTAGLVTLEDVIEEIVGEIRDEHDETLDFYERLGPKRFLVDGRMEIASANERLKLDIPEGEYATIAGFLIHHFEHIPKKGESITIGKYHYTVHRATKRAVHEVEIVLREKEPAS